MPTKREKIIDLTNILELDKNTTDYFGHILKTLEQEIVPKDFKIVKEFFSKDFVPIILQDMYNSLEDSVDEETLDSLLGFYKSELGQKLLKVSEQHSKAIKDLSENKWQKMLLEGLKKLEVLNF